MNLSEFSVAELGWRLRETGIFYSSGPFTLHLKSSLPDLAPLLHWLYAHYPIVVDEAFADIHIRLIQRRKLRHWLKPEAQVWVDDETPFAMFPQDTALPFLEWATNWCVATRADQYLMLHAGVVEKHGKAILLPAWPGSGKSTLCAALVHRGWRLLSDEFALVRPRDLEIAPFPRLIPLKNESIGVIRTFAPDAVLGPEFPKTRKGTVSHLRPPAASIACAGETAQAAWIISPKFQAGAKTQLTALPKPQAFIGLSHNSFNYNKIGLHGFKTVRSLVESCDCYFFQYSNLEQAVTQLDALVAGQI